MKADDDEFKHNDRTKKKQKKAKRNTWKTIAFSRGKKKRQINE